MNSPDFFQIHIKFESNSKFTHEIALDVQNESH